MAIDNYENLGFQVKIDGADTVETHLGKIVKRLKQIQQLNKVLGNIGGNNGKGGGSGSSRQKLTDEERWDKQYQDKMRKQAYYLKQGYVQQRNIISEHTKWVLAEEKKLEKKRFLTEQGYIQEKPKLTEEEQFRNSFEKSKRRREFGIQEGYIQEKQSLSEIEKYLQRVNAEKDKLNDKTYEEARRIELANQQRKKEIDQRLKQELGIKETTKSLTAYLAKLSSGVMIARRLGKFVSGAIQESANYVENLNLFAVAYGDVYQETLGWALDLADGFGLASNEVLKFAGTFRQLSTSLGLVEDTANSVSKTVTQLGYDMSALFNTSVENAMEKLQSGLFSGNVRPLRAYGIDISQNQIDALFETNQALAGLGVNARNLSQSDKVLARLIITLRDGSNAFGTMNREINTLQSQIRILQGSFSNFKLAIGDLVYEPVRKALVVVNAFIMAVTNIIRRIKPLQTEDKNNIFNGVAMGAEEANEQIDELNGKLADFDKFNVLGGQSQGDTSSAVTEALTAELAKQQEYYEQQVDLMDDIQNEAKEFAKSLEPLIIGFGVLATILAVKKISSSNSWFLAFASKETGDSIAKIATSVGELTKGTQLFAGVLKTLTGPVGIILAVVGVLYATNKEFRESINSLIKSIVPLFTILFDLVNQILKPLMPLISGILNLVGIGLSYVVKVLDWTSRLGLGLLSGILYPLELIAKALSTVIELFRSLFTLDFSNLGKNLSALWSNWATTDFAKKNFGSLGRFADGGYTNANLIMTHENGKREWVGKAAGSSAIVNDTQMSDIMEVAVAKGVYNALSARSAMGGNVPTNETIVVKIGEEAVFNAVRKTARRQGRDFANI